MGRNASWKKLKILIVSTNAITEVGVGSLVQNNTWSYLDELKNLTYELTKSEIRVLFW